MLQQYLKCQAAWKQMKWQADASFSAAADHAGVGPIILWSQNKFIHTRKKNYFLLSTL